MNSALHLSSEDAALVALQLLPDNELREAVEHARTCELCREEISRSQGDLVGYALTAEAAEPPVRSRERLLRRVAQEPKLVPVEAPTIERAEAPALLSRYNDSESTEDTEVEEPQKSVAPFLAWTGWALAAGLAVAGGLQYRARVQAERGLAAQTAVVDESGSEAGRAQQSLAALTETGAMQVVLHQPSAKDAAKPEAHAAYSQEKGSLVLLAAHLQPLQSYKTYELWLLPAEDGLNPIPVGLFKPDAEGSATLITPDMPKGVKAKGFGITVEDEGGAKQPTLPIVLAGT